jgi:hypothetical protein
VPELKPKIVILSETERSEVGSKDLHLARRANQLLRHVPRITQIDPRRVDFLDQCNLFGPSPSLQLLLARNRAADLRGMLEPNQTVGIVARGKTSAALIQAPEGPLLPPF